MPNLTKKHYVAIARTLAQPVGEFGRDASADMMHGARATSAAIAYRLADYFASDNPRFDRSRFLAACGVEEVTI